MSIDSETDLDQLEDPTVPPPFPESLRYTHSKCLRRFPLKFLTCGGVEESLGAECHCRNVPRVKRVYNWSVPNLFVFYIKDFPENKVEMYISEHKWTSSQID